MFHNPMFAKEAAHAIDNLLADARRASGHGDRRVQVLDEGPGYELRQITLMAGEELPFRRNPHLAKTWSIVSGCGHADIAEAEFALLPEAEIAIAPGELHQIENRGAEPLVLHERRTLIGSRPAA